jgi:hypothetical protein
MSTGAVLSIGVPPAADDETAVRGAADPKPGSSLIAVDALEGDPDRSGLLGGGTVADPSGAAGQAKTEERRLRRLFVTSRSLLQAAEQADDERDVVMTVLQAAAIWHDLDARAYRRDLLGRFVLDVSLPGADLTMAPRDFSVFSVNVGPIARISSTVEQQQLGWHNLSGELVLMPIAMSGQVQPRWVLAVPMMADAAVPSSLLLLCEALGQSLSQLEARRCRELRSRLRAELVAPGKKIPQLAAAALERLASVLGAERARLLVGPSDASEGGEDAQLRTMASTGGEWTAGPLPKLAIGQSLLAPTRMTVQVALAANAVAILDMTAQPDADFTVGKAVLLEEAVDVLNMWLAGMLQGTAAGAEVKQPPQFEPRIDEELARAQHLRVETGLLLIDTPPKAERQEAWARAGLPLEDVLAKQLRSSDVTGRLEDGTIAALMLRTGVDGSAAVAARARRSLDTLARERGLPAIALGVTTFGLERHSVNDVVGWAREDAARRGHGGGTS